jgi:hypothetical protein
MDAVDTVDAAARPMNAGHGSQAETARVDRFERALEHRRRWARDAAVLGTVEPWRLQDTAALGAMPDWVGEPEAIRRERAVLAGAVLRARALRRIVSGPLLSALVATIGAPRLEAVLALPARVPLLDATPLPADLIEHLHALGGELLVRTHAGPPSIRAAIARLFPPSDAFGQADPAALRWVADDVAMLWRRFDAAPVSPQVRAFDAVIETNEAP